MRPWLGFPRFGPTIPGYSDDYLTQTIVCLMALVLLCQPSRRSRRRRHTGPPFHPRGKGKSPGIPAPVVPNSRPRPRPRRLRTNGASDHPAPPRARVRRLAVPVVVRHRDRPLRRRRRDRCGLARVELVPRRRRPRAAVCDAPDDGVGVCNDADGPQHRAAVRELLPPHILPGGPRCVPAHVGRVPPSQHPGPGPRGGALWIPG